MHFGQDYPNPGNLWLPIQTTRLSDKDEKLKEIDRGDLHDFVKFVLCKQQLLCIGRETAQKTWFLEEKTKEKYHDFFKVYAKFV